MCKITQYCTSTSCCFHELQYWKKNNLQNKCTCIMNRAAKWWKYHQRIEAIVWVGIVLSRELSVRNLPWRCLLGSGISGIPLECRKTADSKSLSIGSMWTSRKLKVDQWFDLALGWFVQGVCCHVRVSTWSQGWPRRSVRWWIMTWRQNSLAYRRAAMWFPLWCW